MLSIEAKFSINFDDPDSNYTRLQILITVLAEPNALKLKGIINTVTVLL